MRQILFLTCLIISLSLCFCAVEFSERPRNFSIELLHYTLLQQKGHALISPFGIWTLMTSVALGASGYSYEELSRAFLLPKDRNYLVAGYKQLSSAVLQRRSQGVSLTSSNFVFLDKNFKVFPEFRRSLEADFGAFIDNLDFKDPNSVNIANSKIERVTGNVKDVMQSSDFQQSKMLLTNVITFKGLWSSPFNQSATREDIFYDENENPIGIVKMMYQRSVLSLSNIRTMSALALELSYGMDDKYCMLFLLPQPKVKVTDVYKKLAEVSLKDIFAQLEREREYFDGQDVEVRIPRFRINTNVVMNKPLHDMGVYDIFEADRARFDKITNEDLFVSAIVHKAEIEVTEAGTVASAATSAAFVDKITSPKFIANKPFIYFVMEKSTLTMLFGGIYSKPTNF